MNFISLEFFKGGSTTQQIRKRDDESPELIALRNQITSMLSPLSGGAKPAGWDDTRFGQTYNDTTQRVGAANQNYDATASALRDQSIAGVKDFGFLSDMMRDVATTGAIPQAMTDNMNLNVNRALKMSMGEQLNNLAGRGVLNSSITNRSANALSDSAADAFSKNYLAAHGAAIDGLGKTISTNQGVFDSQMRGLGGAADHFLGAPKAMWEGQQLEFAPVYNLWQEMQKSHDSKEDFDTVITKNGK